MDNNSQTSAEYELCRNCQNPLAGPYCGSCGQSKKSVIRHFSALTADLFEDFLGYDSRAMRTLRPLAFKPGFLSLEYFSGKRVSYVPPLRLYLFASIIFFLAMPYLNEITLEPSNGDGSGKVKEQYLAGFDDRLQHQISQAKNSADYEQRLSLHAELKQRQQQLVTSTNPIKTAALISLSELLFDQLNHQREMNPPDLDKIISLRALIEKINRLDTIPSPNPEAAAESDSNMDIDLPWLSPDEDKIIGRKIYHFFEKTAKSLNDNPEVIIEQALSALPSLMFLMLPIFALQLKFFYLFSKRLYIEHLIVALHSHSFIFLTILLISLLDKLGETYLSLSGLFDTLLLLPLIWLPCYLFIMQKRVYHQSALVTGIKYCLCGGFYLGLLLFIALTAFVWGALTI